jgi:hypothetical protein
MSKLSITKKFSYTCPLLFNKLENPSEAVYDANLFEETMDETAIYDYNSVSYILHPTSCT